ncbi:uncharacterized protein LOC100194147 [Zea mays]|uniref:Uncharacterized protein n=1 Tax=Zea mays TaxID=4577 RepID=B4FHL6_MAIZE|nr:uncharacterized protein LOC100194147 [Zea mays]ACF81609.1 unknown [Zea mays]|eukprot:NP_001132670.1 uncharacterized protein LOC100194147 [Zea mays]
MAFVSLTRPLLASVGSRAPLLGHGHRAEPLRAPCRPDLPLPLICATAASLLWSSPWTLATAACSPRPSSPTPLTLPGLAKPRLRLGPLLQLASMAAGVFLSLRPRPPPPLLLPHSARGSPGRCTTTSPSSSSPWHPARISPWSPAVPSVAASQLGPPVSAPSPMARPSSSPGSRDLAVELPCRRAPISLRSSIADVTPIHAPLLRSLELVRAPDSMEFLPPC